MSILKDLFRKKSYNQDVSKEIKNTPQPLSCSYRNNQNERSVNHHTPNPQLNELHSDLVIFFGNRLCPYCSVYSNRVFSISGKDKRFPAFINLPQNLRVISCPECESFIGFSSYFDIDYQDNLKKNIEFSNRPFVDSRTDEEKELYSQEKKRKIQDTQNRLDYQWLLTNLPELAPKSFSAYVRMRNAQTEKYLLIKEESEKAGYYIK